MASAQTRLAVVVRSHHSRLTYCFENFLGFLLCQLTSKLTTLPTDSTVCLVLQCSDETNVPGRVRTATRIWQAEDSVMYMYTLRSRLYLEPITSATDDEETDVRVGIGFTLIHPTTTISTTPYTDNTPSQARSLHLQRIADVLPP
jgi:hypothetical protein